MKVISLVVLLAVAACAQTMVNSTGSGTGSGFTGSSTFRPQPFAPPAITGAAYSGEEVNEHVQTLEDGTHITSKQSQRKVWRDSQGRMRTERPMFMNPNATNVPTIVEITDPVARVHYVLDAQNKVAHRMTLPEPPNRMAAGGGGGARGGVMTGVVSTGSAPIAVFSAIGQPVPPPPPPPAMANAPMMIGGSAGPNAVRPKFASESLGTKIIDGVAVEGTRTTVTYLVGSVGNDRDFSTTTESWMAPSLKLQVLSISRDPRSGENTHRIANLSRNEPDPSLFLPPADYLVVDEKEQFTITYKGQ